MVKKPLPKESLDSSPVVDDEQSSTVYSDVPTFPSEIPDSQCTPKNLTTKHSFSVSKPNIAEAEKANSGALSALSRLSLFTKKNNINNNNNKQTQSLPQKTHGEREREQQSQNTRQNTQPRFLLFQIADREQAQRFTTALIDFVDRSAGRTVRKCLTSVPLISNSLIQYWNDQIQDMNRLSSADLEVPDSDEDAPPIFSRRISAVPTYTIPPGAANVLNNFTASQITSHLPPSVAFKSWVLAFCPKLHGVSYSTFYRKVSGKGNCVLLVKDTAGVVFGGYSSETFHKHKSYYGSGEMFVFTFKGPNPERPAPKNSPICVFPWSSANAFFMFSDNQNLAIGGGGFFAITIDKDFMTGSSNPCPTFNSPCLASAEDFKVKDIQVWVFDDG